MGGETTKKNLQDLFRGVTDTQPPNVFVRGLTADSRKVEPGFIFAALPGTQTDGARFIADALAAGAAAVLSGRGIVLPKESNSVHLVSDNPRRALALAAARFFGDQPSTVAAVTGTNGKTSVATFVRQVWTRLGHKAASLGTLGAIGPNGGRLDEGAPLTTPDPVALQALLAGLARDGFDHVALEASSHGLDQFRLDGVKVRAAGFTNFSRDHLDYHGTEEKYLAAKLRLFTDILEPGGIAVVNMDAPKADIVARAAQEAGRTVWRVGCGGDRLRLVSLVPTGSGQSLEIEADGRVRRVTVGLAGAFQASNMLVSAGLAIACGAGTEEVLSALSGLEGAPGRMEAVGETRAGGAVYVDYAHTPDALRTVLEALRPHAKGRLHVIFGCGGDRDPGKRPMMGALAAELADRVILTDDNPRSEDAARIRRQVKDGMPAGVALVEIADRHAAIAEGLAGLAPGDVLLIAGKGHESGQIVGKTVLPFDDRAVARKLMNEAQPAGGADG